MESLTVNTEPGVEVKTPAAEDPLKSAGVRRMFLPLVFVITFVAYSGTLGYEFVYDDIEQIVRNRYLTSWEYFPRYFTEHLWAHRDYSQPGNYYRPLFLVWLRLNRLAFGLNPVLWHLGALLLYLASVYLVYRMVNRLSRNSLTAILAAMLFALSPLHIEVAAWVSGVTEPLLAVLLIPAFICYLNRYHPANREPDTGEPTDTAGKFKWLGASLLLYTAALFSKETAIILPVIIAGYELIFRDRRRKPGKESDAGTSNSFASDLLMAATRSAPYVLIGIVYLLIRAQVLGMIYKPTQLPASAAILTIPSLLWEYLKLLVWPFGLSEFYDTPFVLRAGFRNFVVPLVAVLAVTSAVAWWIWRMKDRGQKRLAAFAIAWIVIPLLPVLNITTFREGDLIHDRYLFLPTVGFSILAALGVSRISIGRGSLMGLPVGQAMATLALAGILGFATSYQHGYWVNEIVLFDRCLAVAPDNEIASNAFGLALSDREMYDKAIVVFEELVRRKPEFGAARYNLGYNYYRVGRYNEALPHLYTAVEKSPTDERQMLTLAVTLFYLDRYDESEQVLKYAIGLRPSGLGLHYALGAVYKETGRSNDALAAFNEELRHNPDSFAAHEQIRILNDRMRTESVGSSPR
jgi:tetratricopeptide (TPR) repeat protein